MVRVHEDLSGPTEVVSVSLIEFFVGEAQPAVGREHCMVQANAKIE